MMMGMKTLEEKAYSNYDIAKLCHVTSVTIYKWLKEGKIPSFKTAGGHYRVRESDLIRFLKSLNIDLPGAAGKTRILVVEDDASLRRLIVRLLQTSLKRIEVFEAVDGYEAGIKTALLKPDLIILDLLLPCLDGVKVCRMIRGEPQLDKIRILSISAYRPEKSKRVILKAGANAFLSKPFDNKAFVEEVKSLLPVPARD